MIFKIIFLLNVKNGIFMKGELFKTMAFDIGESVFIYESEVMMYI